eukprot:364407-Chlamydomonas_euryale.AAC.12
MTFTDRHAHALPAAASTCAAWGSPASHKVWSLQSIMGCGTFSQLWVVEPARLSIVHCWRSATQAFGCDAPRPCPVPTVWHGVNPLRCSTTLWCLKARHTEVHTLKV